MVKQIVYLLGNKTPICEKHYKEKFPGMPIPNDGWEFGSCIYCEKKLKEKKNGI